MPEEILSRVFFGNTVLAWGQALLIIVLVVLLSKFLFWVFKRFVRRLTRKTETRLDDLVLSRIQRPFLFGVNLMGIRSALAVLTLPEWLDTKIAIAFQALLVILGTWLIARLVDVLYTEYLAPIVARSDGDLDDHLLPILRKFSLIAIWVFGLVVALNNAGYNVGALIAGLGIGGLAVAMAAKDTLSNVFGGLTILADRPFTLNDRIQISGFDGFVREVGLRSTRLETLAGRMVTIPNANFMGSPVENISVEPSRKVVLDLGLTYDTTPEQMEQAIAILRQIVAEDDELEEKVFTTFSAFGDFALNLNFIYYIKKGSDIVAAMSRVNLRILQEFNGHGLDFAFPTQTIYTPSLEASRESSDQERSM